MEDRKNYAEMTITEKIKLLYAEPQYVDSSTVKFKINADFIRLNTQDESYRELMVSYIPMLPLLEKTVALREADYILYMHPYARCEDLSDAAVSQIKKIAENRKPGATIIVVGKAANAEALLNGEVQDIIFWGDHFTEKLGNMFGMNIREQYFVYDEREEHLAIWPVDGCLNKCKFCRRTYMEIKFESISLGVIKRQLDFFKRTAPEKMRTISLRAENLTQYGLDIYGKQMLHKLIDLIDSYDEVESIEIPIGPCIGEITPEILDSLCRTQKLTSIHMSLEAGSDRLLKFIGKKHTVKQAFYVFGKLREAHPKLNIESTVIIGLPTEELSDMEDLAFLVLLARPNYLRCNYYDCNSREPLAQYPQISKSLREYHLKVFLKTLRDNVLKINSLLEYPWTIVVTHEAIAKDKSSRKEVRRAEEIKRDNESWKERGVFPQHKVGYVMYRVGYEDGFVTRAKYYTF